MKGTVLQTTTLILLIGVLVLQVLALRDRGSGGETLPGGDTDSIRAVASALKSEGLYEQAVQEYGKLLEGTDLSPGQKANILLLIGEMQKENLKDYEGALASYVRIRTSYPETDAVKKAEREMVACLELLDRGRDAQRQLAKVTDLKPKPDEVRPSDVVVARIGKDRKITLREIEEAINRMPEYMRASFDDPERKLEFTRTYVAKELMANMALRKGYEKDPELRERLEDFRRELLADRVYTEEVRDRVQISEGDLDLYYRANTEKFTEPEKVRVAHIQVSDESKAAEIVDSVTPGTDFAELAAAESEDERTRSEGGSLPPFSREGAVPGIGRADAFVEAAFSPEIGDVTGPVKTDRGYHVLKLLEKIPEQVRSLEDVRSMAERGLRQEKEQEAFEALMQRMLEAQEAAIYEDAVLKGEES